MGTKKQTAKKPLAKNNVKENDNGAFLTVGLPTYNSNIVWLAMESLCRQQTTVIWELIICEEEHNGNKKEYYDNYKKRLEKVGCVEIKYIPIKDLPENVDKIALSQKWRIIAKESSKSSIGLILQASDCYSEPKRLQTAYQKLCSGFDWIHSRFGIFYHLYDNKNILFDMKSGEYETGLNMSMAMDIARNLPDEDKFSSVDFWLYQFASSFKKNFRTYLDISDNWMNGLDTDGGNNITIRRQKYYMATVPPFTITNILMDSCVPDDIAIRIHKYNKGIVNITEMLKGTHNVQEMSVKANQEIPYEIKIETNTNVLEDNTYLISYICERVNDTFANLVIHFLEPRPKSDTILRGNVVQIDGTVIYDNVYHVKSTWIDKFGKLGAIYVHSDNVKVMNEDNNDFKGKATIKKIR